MQTKLDTFDPRNFDKKAGAAKKTAWFFLHVLFIESSWMPLMHIKVILLRMFGAKIGNGLIIKPSVHIKYPWKLIIGDHVWLGEKVLIILIM